MRKPKPRCFGPQLVAQGKSVTSDGREVTRDEARTIFIDAKMGGGGVMCNPEFKVG